MCPHSLEISPFGFLINYRAKKKKFRGLYSRKIVYKQPKSISCAPDMVHREGQGKTYTIILAENE